MKKILLFVMLMFAVNVMLFNSTSTDLFAAKKQAKEQKATKAAKKETKAAKAEKAAKKEAREEKAAKREAKAAKAEKAAKKEARSESKATREEGRQTRGADGRTYIQGPRGGCYYINANGNKTYVDHSMCK